MAKIDVLIPAFNAAGTLREAIESLQRQTFADIRIVVVNDGSTDGTAALLEEISRADPRVHVITKANDGIVEARSDGFNACTAEFFACLDADDVAFPDRFERQLAYLYAHPDCVAVGGRVEHMDEHGAPLSGLPQPGQPALADPASVPAVVLAFNVAVFLFLLLLLSKTMTSKRANTCRMTLGFMSCLLAI